MGDRPDLVRHYGWDGFVGRLDDALTKAVGCRSLGGPDMDLTQYGRLKTPAAN